MYISAIGRTVSSYCFTTDSGVRPRSTPSRRMRRSKHTGSPTCTYTLAPSARRTSSQCKVKRPSTITNAAGSTRSTSAARVCRAKS